MARASFTLKRYLPLNQETQESSDWVVFNGRPESGASNTSASVGSVLGSNSFEVLIHAQMGSWIPNGNDDISTDALFSAGSATEGLIIQVLQDGAFVPGGLNASFYDSSSNYYDIVSEAPPFLDGNYYWIKFVFDLVNETGAFYYAADSSTVPTGWTQLANEEDTISGISIDTSQFDGLAIGHVLNLGSVHSLSNGFSGNIKRLIIKTFTGQVTEYFYYTGSAENFVVPSGVSTVETLLWGGGRTGGQVFGDLSVTGGDTLTIRVGGANSGATGGWPNGGNGGTNSADSKYGNGGCGASDIKNGATILMVAGGQGGDVESDATLSNSDTEYRYFGSNGGTGSNTLYSPTTSSTNTPNGCDGASLSYGGKGGTQNGAGAAGTSSSTNRVTAPTAGSGQQGGNGVFTNTASTNGKRYAGGGGGGGYYGGGGGGSLVSGSSKIGYPGGGGSSYVNTVYVSNYKFSVRPTSDLTLGKSWYTIGSHTLNDSYTEYVPPIITDTTDNLSGTEVFGPPQPDYDVDAFDGLVVLRYTD